MSREEPTAKTPAGNCEGCGAELFEFPALRRRNFVDLPLCAFPWQETTHRSIPNTSRLERVPVGEPRIPTVRVCRGESSRNSVGGEFHGQPTFYGHHGVSAKRSCATKAREKALRCPGCGAQQTSLGTICEGCAAALTRERAMEPTQWALVDAYSLLPWTDWQLSREHDGMRDKFARLLVTALCGRGARAGNGLDVDSNYTWIRGAERHETSRTTGTPAVEVTTGQLEAARELVGLFYQLVREQRMAGRREGSNLLVGLAQGDLTADQFDAAERKLLDEDKLR